MKLFPKWKKWSSYWWFSDILDDGIELFQNQIVARKTFKNEQEKISWMIDTNLSVRRYLAKIYLVSFFMFPILAAVCRNTVLTGISVLLVLALFFYNPVEELTLI